MKIFLKNILLLNGLVNIGVGIALILIPIQMADLLGYPELPAYTSFIIGGWGIAALSFGIGRVSASRDQKKFRLWAFLGLVEGAILTVFCLKYWLSGTLVFLQVSVPLLVALIFGSAYAISYPSWSKMKY
ncbi:MAG: hypothetical protein PVF22_02690 [Candidatus Aminicenantes bacterium]|jgi:hypothetical protein